VPWCGARYLRSFGWQGGVDAYHLSPNHWQITARENDRFTFGRGRRKIHGIPIIFLDDDETTWAPLIPVLGEAFTQRDVWERCGSVTCTNVLTGNEGEKVRIGSRRQVQSSIPIQTAR
jgi:hypothetical protein